MESTEKPRISVVICVKNRPDFLAQALKSLQRQTFADWECVIVDDHSTEDIAATVGGFNEPRFRYIKNEGKPGISASRNLGNREARADWVAVADSDDINLPLRLQTMAAAIEANPDVDVFYSTIYCVNDGTYDFFIWKSWQVYDRELLYTKNHIPHGSVVYRRELVVEVGYNEELQSAVDYDLWLSLSDRRRSFLYIDQPLMVYRMHGEQISTDPVRRAQQDANTLAIQERHRQYIEAPLG
ncbi:MAG: glycosyltransferase [bacterium]